MSNPKNIWGDEYVWRNYLVEFTKHGKRVFEEADLP